MRLYTYAIIDSNREMDEVPQLRSGLRPELLSKDEPLRGLGEASVYNIPYRDIGIVVSGLDPQVQIKTKESILKHEEVAERLMDRFTVLPMRLYTVFSGKEDMLLKMKDYYEDFIENLDRVRNKAEFGIKVIWAGNIIKERIISAHKNESPAHSAQSGMTFMKEKFERYKSDKEFEEEADRCIALVDGFLNRLASEKKLEKLKSNNLLLSASYLVDNEKRVDFKKAFEELRSSPGDLKYLLSGPWPAYNFITLSRSVNGKFGGPDLIETILQHKNPEEKDEK